MCSKHFMTRGVRATGQKSLTLFGLLLLGTGQTVGVFYNKGTLLVIMDQLNSLPNTTANCSLQVFSIEQY